MTALHYASLLGKIKVATLLLESGAEPDIKDNYGFSPLFYAVLGDKNKVKKLLLENGASPLDDNEKQELILLLDASSQEVASRTITPPQGQYHCVSSSKLEATHWRLSAVRYTMG